MRAIVFSLIAFHGFSAWCVPEALSRCEPYLSAPTDLKYATKEVLSTKTNKKRSLRYRTTMDNYVREAPVGSEELANFLVKLNVESPNQETQEISALGSRLLLTYLMKDGNTELAVKHLPTFLGAFWINFIYGQLDPIERPPIGLHSIDHRFSEGYALLDNAVRFLRVLYRTHPNITKAEWKTDFKRFLPDLMNMQGFLSMLARARDDGRRLEYVRAVIKELEYSPDHDDTDSLIQFYTLDEDRLLRTNEIFQEDQDSLRGESLKSITPLRSIVFLWRLTKRLSNEFARPAGFRKADSLIREIKAFDR